MKKSYPEIWFRDVSPEDKEKMIALLNHSQLIDRLREILEGWENELSVSRGDYDNPSWAYKQAHENGLIEAYTKIKRLFDHKEIK